MTNNKIKIQHHKQGIAQLTLNQPEIHNAFDDQLISDITRALLQLDNDPSVRVLILDAKGKSFSAGADLNWMRRMADYTREENYRDSVELANLMSTLHNMKCPTIAAVQGAAFGGGVGLVACCDIAIASDNVNFCLSEVKLGLIPAAISPYVVKAIGERAAKRYFVTAERFNARRAEQLGLISEIVATVDVQTKAMSIAQQITDNGPEAVISAKQIINDVVNQNIDETLRTMTASRIADIRASVQGKEGVSAFLDKRQAKWSQE